jgi:hypothetical protein
VLVVTFDGAGDFVEGDSDFSMNPVPEPAAFALVAGLLALLGARLRRRTA